MIRIRHNIQVTSFGGSGTTMLLRFLKEQGVSVPRERDSGIWKHLPTPPIRQRYTIPARFRAVYLVADPIDALLSVFRRGYHMWHAVRTQSTHRWPSQLKIQDYPHEPTWGISEFTKLKSDCYGIHDQFEQWTTCPFSRRGYPIMVLHYESLWDHLEQLVDFVGLPDDRVAEFPAREEREERELILEQARYDLEAVYGTLARAIQRLPGHQVL